MSKVCIITDSNSGITQSESKELGIVVIPMPFYINEVQHFEDIDMTQEEFYEALMDEKTEVSTSQPSPDTIMQTWRENLEEYDEIVHIPMSSGISSSCATAMMLAQEEEFEGKVFVVDNQRISVTQRRSVQQAKELAERGYSAKEIHDILFRDKFQSSIYIMVNTLKYLRKGGRLTPAVAAIGTVLRIKPVLQIQGEKLDSFSKSRGWKSAKKTMLDAMEKDLTERFAGQEMYLQVAYTCSAEEAEEWKAEVENRFPEYEVHMDPLSLSVACHIGHGARAIACSRKVPELS